MSDCIKCGRVLTHDEIALHKKLFNKLATEFMCKNCCAKYFDVEEKLMDEKIEQYKKLGCTLFI